MTVQKKSRRDSHMLEFATVRYWQGQLNECGVKNSACNRTDTRTASVHQSRDAFLAFLFRAQSLFLFLPADQFGAPVLDGYAPQLPVGVEYDAARFGAVFVPAFWKLFVALQAVLYYRRPGLARGQADGLDAVDHAFIGAVFAPFGVGYGDAALPAHARVGDFYPEALAVIRQPALVGAVRAEAPRRYDGIASAAFPDGPEPSPFNPCLLALLRADLPHAGL